MTPSRLAQQTATIWLTSCGQASRPRLGGLILRKVLCRPLASRSHEVAKRGAQLVRREPLDPDLWPAAWGLTPLSLCPVFWRGRSCPGLLLSGLATLPPFLLSGGACVPPQCASWLPLKAHQPGATGGLASVFLPFSLPCLLSPDPLWLSASVRLCVPSRLVAHCCALRGRVSRRSASTVVGATCCSGFVGGLSRPGRPHLPALGHAQAHAPARAHLHRSRNVRRIVEARARC